MFKINALSDTQKSTLIDNLWNESATLWSIVEKSFSKNLKIWQNQPEWLADVPTKRSKARDNRIFLAVESIISTLTGRPSKPNASNVLKTDEAKQIANDLQETFLAKYRDLGLKGKIRQGLRHLFISRFICLKVIWDKEKDDFDVVVVDPRNVRVSKGASSMFDTEFAIEKVKDVSLRKLIATFPEKEEDILKLCGYKKDQILTENPSQEYYEAWVDGQVIYKFKDTILYTEKHPYWDWQGMNLTTREMLAYKEGDTNILNKANKQQSKRVVAEGEKSRYENFLYNYFDEPIPPYVFGTVLKVENNTIGDSSLIDQTEPLQVEIDKRKRQISDNTEMMNGQYKVDTEFVQITKAEALAAKSDPRGIWYGKGVSRGVEVMTGKEMPITVFNEMNHSITELDNIFGTQPTFRGEGGQSETATGRAILREQSFSRLDELIDLVDTIHLQLYQWMFQMIKVRYTERHLIKTVGLETAQRVIELTRNNINDGVEIQIIPGQIIPQDRLFKSERAKEEVIAGVIDPLTYFEETERDNPQELAKRVVKFKLNPLSILDMDEQDMADLQKGQGQMPGEPQKASQLAGIRQQAEELTKSPEFQALPPDQQEQAIKQIEDQVNKLIKTNK